MRTERGIRTAAPPTRRAAPRRTNRRFLGLAALAGAAVLFVALLVVPLLALRQAQAHLTAGQRHLEEARDALGAVDLDTAITEFSAATERIDAGQATLKAGALRAAGALPLVGTNLDATRSLADAAAHVADAGTIATTAVADLPGGLAAFAPRDGALPLEPLQRLADPLAEAADQLAAAQAAVDAAPDRRLVGPIARARTQAEQQVGEAREVLTAGAALAEQLPAFLGADGPRRYFVGAQNPAELRGTGGLVGAFGILTADRGRIAISEFRNIGELTAAAPDDLPPPSEDYAARYARFGATTHGSNINMTPDVPTAARAIETLYQAATGEQVDGTILTDPLLLRALLEVVGPTEVPEIGTMTAENVVHFVTVEQYEVFPGPSDERKEALGEIAAAVLRRFLSEGLPDPRRAITVFGEAAGAGRLYVHARDEEVQAALAEAGLDGALADVEGDYLGVVANNAAGNKADAFLEREITYEVELQPDGSALGHVQIDLTNTAPTEGLDRSVIGPFDDGFAAGENRTYWSVYCPDTCELERFSRNGQEEPLSAEREEGRRVYATTTSLASGESEQLSFSWRVSDAWRPAGDGGIYELGVRTQPGIEPDPVRVRIHAPPGTHLRSASPPLAVQGGGSRAVGGLPRTTSLFVGFAPRRDGLARAMQVLNRPLVTLSTR